MLPATIMLTCEHAGNRVPDTYRDLFAGHETLLQSHRGWDPGALIIAQHLATVLHSPLFSNDITRLLIEVNRSPRSSQLFSSVSERLSPQEKQKLMEEIYDPYRKGVETHLNKLHPPVLHLSIHSFTPVLEGVTRQLEVGILFDPARDFESSVAETLRSRLAGQLPGWRIGFNEPYQGIDDGFTTTLRSTHPDNRYAGIEIEANQKLLEHDLVDQLKMALGIVVTGMLFQLG